MDWRRLLSYRGTPYPKDVLAESAWSFVFEKDGLIYKFVNEHVNTVNCHPDRVKVSAAEEALTLRKIRELLRAPKFKGFESTDRGTLIKMSKVGISDFQSWTPKIAFSYIEQLYMLNKFIGMQHNDANKNNIRIDKFGEVNLIDFDQCRVASEANDFTSGRCYKAVDILGEDGIMNLQEMKDQLCKAWDIARKSNASAPGELMAYYRLNSFDHAGLSDNDSGAYLSGERDWEARWAQMRPALLRACGGTLEGKRILELGHNMGLLSIWAAREGAICTGVEMQSDIQEASRLIADAFGVYDNCKWINADMSHWLPTEEYDVVTCCRLMYHVPNKENLIKAMGCGKSILFEGHDAPNVEIGRINRAGYDNVEVVYRTERGTDLFLGTKS